MKNLDFYLNKVDNEYRNLCIQIIRRNFIYNDADIEEIIQDVKVQLWKMWKRKKEITDDFGGLAVFITGQRVNVFLRTKYGYRLQRKNFIVYTDFAMHGPKDYDEADYKNSGCLDSMIAYDLLSKLSPEICSCLELYYMHGYNGREVAKMLKIPTMRVYRNVRKGIKELRQLDVLDQFKSKEKEGKI